MRGNMGRNRNASAVALEKRNEPPNARNANDREGRSNESHMGRRIASWAVLCLSIAGCGGAGASGRTVARFDPGALPIAAGARLYFDSASTAGPREMTVSVVDTAPEFRYELGCGHIEPARALASPTTGVVDESTMAGGRDEYAIDHCDHRADHDGAALPEFLVSTRALTALDHHERTLLRVADHGAAVALMPVGHESLSVRIDGRPTPIDTLHARGDGMDLWIADVGTPIVVRVVDHERGFTLSGIDTPGARTPRAR